MPMTQPTPNETDRLQAALNAADVVEKGWYERSHIAYELVCYVNNVVGLRLAGNRERIPGLLDRAHGYLTRDDAARLNAPYRDAVLSYLRAVAREVAEDPSVSERSKGLIPRALLAPA